MYRASISSYKSSNSPIRARDSYFFSSSPQKTPSNKISASISHNHKETARLSIGPLSPKSPITSSKLAHIKMSSTLPSFQRPLPDHVNTRETGKNQDTPFSYNRKESQMGVLFHLEKPHYLTDAAQADVMFRQDFATQRKKPEHNDAIDVRKLDEWQMTFGRSKNHISLTKPTDLMEQFKSKNKQHKEMKERKDFPSVRQDLLNRIIGLPDEDDLLGVRNNHGSRLPSIMDNQIMGKRSDKRSDSFEPQGTEIRAGARSLEVMQRENNKDILNDLINKKIREFIRTINVDEMTEEQLRVHVKKVAEGVVAQFKTLKGPSGSFIVHNCVESTVKALKSKKQDAELLFADVPKTKNKKENVGMDYEMMEDLLMEKFESCVQNEEDFKDQVKQLTTECYNYKKELISIQYQIDEINQKYGPILTEEAPPEDKLNGAIKNIARRYGMTLMDMQAKRAEKQFELNDYFKKQNLIKEKVAATVQGIQIRENDIEVSRSQKDYYRTQLRDLYYKCLKDDVALVYKNEVLQENKFFNDRKEKKTPMSYAWVIRSLWRIHEETKESAFPSFLDSTSIRFIIEYARAQDELEEYCKVNNIMNLISNVEDFRCLSKHIDSSHFNGPESMDQNSSASFIHQHQQVQKPQVRNLETMMEYVKDQMTALKRVNLKAKRQVPVGRHAFKAKGIVYKWEEVDPNQIDRIISHQPDQGSYDLTSDGQRNSKIEDHHQIVWEIGHDKLKALMAARKKELDRLFKQNIGKELDERLKSNLLKAFNFLLGKIGPETHTRFIREKAVYEQNAQGKAKKASMSNNPYIKSPGSTSVPTSPMSISTSKLAFGQALLAHSFYNEPSSPLSPGKFSALPTNGSFMQDDLKESAMSIPKNDFDVTRNSGNWLAVPGSGVKKTSSTSRL